MPRCTDCNRYVTIEEPDVQEAEMTLGGVETNENDSDAGTVSVSASVQVTLPCPECGTEIAETTFEIEQDIKVTPCVCGCTEVDSDPSTDCTDIVDKRKRKAFEVTVSGDLVCADCGKVLGVYSLTDSCAQADFDTL